MDHARVTRVRLLDGFTLQLPGAGPGSAPDLPRAVQRLIAHLSLSGRPARTAIAGKLWPDVTEEHAHGSLRSSLWRVHKIAPGLITVACGNLSIAHDVLVDVNEFSEWARQALDPCWDADRIATRDLGQPGELLP